MTPDIDSSVWEVLQQYSFEGNVQELKNIVHYAAAILEGQTVFLHHLPPFVLLPQQTAGKGKKKNTSSRLWRNKNLFSYSKPLSL